MTDQQKFDDRFELFLDGAKDIVDDYYVDSTINPVLEVTHGKRYIRIIKKDQRGGDSAWGFVDKTNGDVLKASSWKSPAKHARGNIFDTWNGTRWVNWHGPMYLDSIPWTEKQELERMVG